MKLGNMTGVRLPEEDRELLLMVCEGRGETLSNFVRRCIRKELASMSFYDETTKKCLGIHTEPSTEGSGVSD